MSSPKPTVRPATPDDADAIIALSAQMDTPLTPAVFRWKYLESPSARISDSVVGVDADGKVVGHAGVVVQPGWYFDLEAPATVVLSLLPPPDVFEDGVRRLVDVVERAL